MRHAHHAMRALQRFLPALLPLVLRHVTRPVPGRTRAAAPALTTLGLLGLAGVAWLDSRATPATTRIALVVWASAGVGVLVTGIVEQCAGRARRRDSGAGTERG
ncbi:hypothetical protein [Streptomyces boluensis]|uniref:Uncharacterized protein n=1 Tax=Streptomyces boluensis TaxID=1775135 RepID=A0A964US09_9ACTN|nr:hypothetical protein [Streptomyces boluensis]NBE53712.1 hypothetical protein [Streptomyces boluensis]